MTTTSEAPEFAYEPWGKYLLRTAKNVFKTFAWICAIGIAIALALNGYNGLDVDGYIPHDRTVDVYMTGNWLVGENRVCWLIQRYDANGKPTGQLDSLQCPIGFENIQPHNLTVTFKGLVDPKDMDGKVRQIPDQWTCTRGSDSFICRPMATPVKPPAP
jgi:hypothetical protein